MQTAQCELATSPATPGHSSAQLPYIASSVPAHIAEQVSITPVNTTATCTLTGLVEIG